MTPAARVAAAIGILDDILEGQPAEPVLSRWGRANRYAGSGDRAAIRDLVFDALRCRRSFGWLGGAETGRGLMLGALRAAGQDLSGIFTGARFAPAPLAADGEPGDGDLASAPRGVRLDCPDWLLEHFDASLGAATDAVLARGRTRAPVYLRVNTLKTDRAGAVARLADEGIVAQPADLAASALLVVENTRKIQTSAAYSQGLVEVQDAGSQAVSDLLPVPEGGRVLDYCAGGGGKTLALAARCRANYFVHDIAPGRMADLPARTTRAGVDVTRLATVEVSAAAPFDLVLLDVPCSGSGSWRRAPEAKWALTPARLQELCATQAEILRDGAGWVAPGGTLAYVTCSLFCCENRAQIDSFLRNNPDWVCGSERVFSPLDGGDGFFAALLQRV